MEKNLWMATMSEKKQSMVTTGFQSKASKLNNSCLQFFTLVTLPQVGFHQGRCRPSWVREKGLRMVPARGEMPLIISNCQCENGWECEQKGECRSIE
nr:hypothetical protein Iba_scaffold10073CG0160 [Ipomoea batatas]